MSAAVPWRATVYFDRAACVGTTAAWITIGAQELTAEAFVGCGPATPVHYCQHAGGHEWPSIGSDAMLDFFRAQLD